MTTRLIELQDGVMVEIHAPQDQAEQISGGFAKKVDASFEKVKPILKKVCQSVSDISQVESSKEGPGKRELQIAESEIEIGLAFEAEGNLYITKSTLGANLRVKLFLKPRN